MLRRLDKVIAILNSYKWPNIELVWDEAAFDATIEGHTLIIYHFRAYNKEFGIDFTLKPLPRYYKVLPERKIQGLSPVTYHELFFYFLFAFGLTYKDASLDDFYDFIEEWARSMLIDMNKYYLFKEELESIIRPVFGDDHRDRQP